MNRREALKRIDRLAQLQSEEYYDHLANGGAKDADYEDDIEALVWAIHALEKQIPKLIYRHINTRFTHWGKVRHDKYICENCGFTKEFTDGHTAQYRYCPKCGQAIDWSYDDD